MTQWPHKSQREASHHNPQHNTWTCSRPTYVLLCRREKDKLLKQNHQSKNQSEPWGLECWCFWRHRFPAWQSLRNVPPMAPATLTVGVRHGEKKDSVIRTKSTCGSIVLLLVERWIWIPDNGSVWMLTRDVQSGLNWANVQTTPIWKDTVQRVATAVWIPMTIVSTITKNAKCGHPLENARQIPTTCSKIAKRAATVVQRKIVPNETTARRLSYSYRRPLEKSKKHQVLKQPRHLKLLKKQLSTWDQMILLALRKISRRHAWIASLCVLSGHWLVSSNSHSHLWV